MDLLTIALVSFIASMLTFFSGFGLGTMLTPVFAIFFPVEAAIALTAIVHFLNNLFKLGLIGKHYDKSLVFRFGIPSVFGAILGAWLLVKLAANPEVFSYEFMGNVFTVRLLNLIIGFLIIVFTLIELLPRIKNLKLKNKHYIAGGVISGFFGGLSGNQGALRTIFLVKAAMSKEIFIATGVVIACMVDITRLGIYSQRIMSAIRSDMWQTVAFAVLFAFAGALAGNKLLKKVTFDWLQKLVTVFLIVIGVLLMAGVI